MGPGYCDERKAWPLMVCSLVEAYHSLFLGFPLLRVLVIAGGFNPWPYWPWKKSRTTEGRCNLKWRHFFLFSTCKFGINKTFVHKYWMVYNPSVEQQVDLWSYLRSWWLGNDMSKQAAAPMRLSEVAANTTWESLQRAEADCCVPIGLVSTLMCNFIYGNKSWILWWKESLTL